jgi:hypothetical protein
VEAQLAASQSRALIKGQIRTELNSFTTALQKKQKTTSIAKASKTRTFDEIAEQPVDLPPGARTAQKQRTTSEGGMRYRDMGKLVGR